MVGGARDSFFDVMLVSVSQEIESPDLKVSLEVWERERMTLDHGDELVHRPFCVPPDRRRAIKPRRVGEELILVENSVRQIRGDEDIYIKIDVAQNVPNENRGHVDITVKATKLAVRLNKSKYVIPSIEPVILDTDRIGSNRTEERMLYLFRKFCVEDQ